MEMKGEGAKIDKGHKNNRKEKGKEEGSGKEEKGSMVYNIQNNIFKMEKKRKDRRKTMNQRNSRSKQRKDEDCHHWLSVIHAHVSSYILLFYRDKSVLL